MWFWELGSGFKHFTCLVICLVQCFVFIELYIFSHSFRLFFLSPVLAHTSEISKEHLRPLMVPVISNLVLLQVSTPRLPSFLLPCNFNSQSSCVLCEWHVPTFTLTPSQGSSLFLPQFFKTSTCLLCCCSFSLSLSSKMGAV